MLLNYLYPERMEQWTVNTRGTFYRNYNRDSMDIDLQQNNVQLARDGLMRLLPEGIFSNERSKQKESREQEKWRLQLVREAFMPLDTFTFRTDLKLEHEVDEILMDGWDFVVRKVFGYSTANTEIAGLLPLIRNRKGDLQFIQALLATLCQCHVTMDFSHRYSHSDSTRRWVPLARYELLIPDLSAQEYLTLNDKLQPLRDFIQEWLVPFDVKCDIVIKHHGQEQEPGEKLILDYNSEL